jgi:hypothetical protein
VKKLLLVIALVAAGLASLVFMVALGRYAAYRDNHTKCENPLKKSAIDDLSIELPDDVLVCRKTDRTESADMELLVEPPGALCLLSSSLAGCPSNVKNQLAFMNAMEGAGWERTGATGKDDMHFARLGKGGTAWVLFRQSNYGEVAATMTVYRPSSKVGKQ